MADIKVVDYPDLRKRGAGVINNNADEFFRARNRIKQSKRLETLEKEVEEVQRKLDILIDLLSKKNGI